MLVVALLFLAIDHRRGDAPGRRVARAAPRAARRRARRPLPRAARRRRRSRSAFAVPRALDQVEHRAEPERQGGRSPRGEAVDRRQARGALALQKRLQHLPERAALVKPRDSGRRQGVRGGHRDLLHVRRRRVLDLRARQDDRRRLLADPATEAQARARHVGPDRREARRVRARPAAADLARRHRRCRCSSGRSASPTGSWSARSPASSRSSR